MFLFWLGTFVHNRSEKNNIYDSKTTSMFFLLQTPYDFDPTIKTDVQIDDLRLYSDADMFNRNDVISKRKTKQNDYVPYSISLSRLRQDTIYHMMTLLQSPDRFHSKMTLNPYLLNKLFPARSVTTTKSLMQLNSFLSSGVLQHRSDALSHYHQLLIHNLRDNTFATQIFQMMEIPYVRHYQTSDTMDGQDWTGKKGLHHYIQLTESGIEKTLVITFKQNQDQMIVLNRSKTVLDNVKKLLLRDESYCENQNLYYMFAMIYDYSQKNIQSISKWCESFWITIISHYAEWIEVLLTEPLHDVWSHLDISESSQYTLDDMNRIITSDKKVTSVTFEGILTAFERWRLKKIGFLNEPIYLLYDPSPFRSLHVHHGIHLMRLAYYLARIQSMPVQTKSMFSFFQ